MFGIFTSFGIVMFGIVTYGTITWYPMPFSVC